MDPHRIERIETIRKLIIAGAYDEALGLCGMEMQEPNPCIQINLLIGIAFAACGRRGPAMTSLGVACLMTPSDPEPMMLLEELVPSPIDPNRKCFSQNLSQSVVEKLNEARRCWQNGEYKEGLRYTTDVCEYARHIPFFLDLHLSCLMSAANGGRVRWRHANHDIEAVED